MSTRRPHGWAQLVLALLAVLGVRVPLFSSGWLAFDDLIPLMYPHQIRDFLTSVWNDYYQWPEVRGRYSLLGTPFRYLPWIPVGLVIGSLLAALGAFRLTFYVQRLVGLTASGWPVGPFVAGVFYLLLTLASKAHQLHTLFLGMGLLPWTLFAFLKAVYAPQARRRWAWGGWTALLLLLNPAIHLVVLGFAALTVLALVLLTERRGSPLRAWSLVGLLGLLPYGLALWLSGPGLTTAATASVPPRLLEAWSGPWGPRLVLPLGLSLPETFRTKTYVFLDDLFARYPWETLGFLVFPALAWVALWTLRRRPLVLAIGALWLGSVFFATGVYYDLSGYRALIALTELPGLLGAPAQVALAVLRNPDRWLLLASLMLAVLSGLGIAGIERQLPRPRLRPRLRIPLVPLNAGVRGVLVLAVLLPFAIHPAFRPLWAGDVGGVLRPVPLPAAYREALALVDGEKTLYLPPMGARPLRGNGSKKTQDEALLLLHGGPSLEGVTGSPLLNQLYLMYAYRRLLYEQRPQALGRYLALGGFRYLFFHDDVEDPIWPDEFRRVREALNASPDLLLRWEQEGVGGVVALFENVGLSRGPEGPAGRELRGPLEAVIAFEGSLNDARTLLEIGVDPGKVGLLHVGEGDLDGTTFLRWVQILGPRLLVYQPSPAGGEEDLLLSLLAADARTAASGETGGAVGYPDPGYGPGARLWWDHRWLNITAFNFVKFFERYGLFGVEGAQDYKLAATVEEGAEVEVPLRIETSGEYTLFLRAAAPLGTRLLVDLDGLYARELELPPSPGYRFWEIDRLRLRAGSHRVRLTTLTNKPVVLNLVLALPTRELVEQRRRWEELRPRVTWVDSPDALLERLERLEERTPVSPPPESALYGYYGPVYWERRLLELEREPDRERGGGGERLRFSPKRSWFIGHLYEVPRGVSLSPERTRFVWERVR